MVVSPISIVADHIICMGYCQKRQENNWSELFTNIFILLVYSESNKQDQYIIGSGTITVYKRS